MIVNQQTLRGIYLGFNTLFNRAFEEEKPLYTEIATVTPSTTDSETYAWLGDIPGMREWIGDREIQNITASDYTIKNKDFELTVGVDRNARLDHVWDQRCVPGGQDRQAAVCQRRSQKAILHPGSRIWD